MPNFRGPRMPKSWSALPAQTQALTANGSAVLGLIDFNNPRTILRMIGEYIITATAVVVALDEVLLTVAIGVFSTDGAAAGAVPDPGSEPGYPWLYWADHPLRFTAGANPVGLNAGAPAVVRHSFDVRSMRKVKPRETLAMILEYTDVVGTPPLTITTGSTRVLIAGD